MHKKNRGWYLVIMLIVVGLFLTTDIGYTRTNFVSANRASEILDNDIDGECSLKSTHRTLEYSCPPSPCVPGNQIDESFFPEVLVLLNIPHSSFAIQALNAWKPYENTVACWNPLATTRKMEYICNFNSVGVQHYQNQTMGTNATAQTLALGYYNAIRTMLRKEGFDREALRSALGTWGTCRGNGCEPLLNTWANLYSQTDPPEPDPEGTVTIEEPSLNPQHNGDTCSTGWMELTNNRGHSFYLTLNTNVQSQSSNNGSWTPDLSVDGVYHVQAYVANHPVISWPCPPYSRISWDTSDARYTITHITGSTTVSANQAPLNNEWLSLGQYSFEVGAGGNVHLSDYNGEDNLSKTIQFGAMRFVLLTPFELPENVQATDGMYHDHVQITWSEVNGASSYEVYRAESLEGARTQIGITEQLVFNDSSINPGTIYYYWVKACNLHGCGGYSEADSGWAVVDFPGKPIGLNATDGTFNDKVDLSWDETDGATYYNVLRSISETGDKETLNQVASSSFSDTSVVLNQVYYYWVNACNEMGCGVDSDPDTGFATATVPEIPTDVFASDGTYSDKVRIQWTGDANGMSYQIFRSDTPDNDRILIGMADDPIYDDSTVVSGNEYWYYVKACVDNLCSDFSLGDMGYAAHPTLDPPTGLHASDGIFLDKVEITWNVVLDSLFYKIFRAESSGGTKFEIGSSITTSFEDFTPTPGVNYWYFVKACHNIACSDFSNGDLGFVYVSIPDVVGGLDASDGDYVGFVKLKWTPAERATIYQVYRALAPNHSRILINITDNAKLDDVTADVWVKYWYWIKACNSTGCSEFGQPDSGYAVDKLYNYQIYIPLLLIN